MTILNSVLLDLKIKAIVSLNNAKVISVTLFVVAILLSLLRDFFFFIPEIAHLTMDCSSPSDHEVKAVMHAVPRECIFPRGRCLILAVTFKNDVTVSCQGGDH